jgi:hypothetical protein
MTLTPILDHAVINVDDQLDSVYSLFCRMGFQLSARGHHSMGSSNHLAIFGENYLELLGYEPSKAQTERGLWRAPLGLAGLVWKTSDAQATYQSLQTLRLAGAPPTSFSRPVTLPDGEATVAEFCITRLTDDAIPNGFSFFCQHITPDAVWQARWQQHPNSVLDLTDFVIMADKPAHAALVYARLFGEDISSSEQNNFLLQAGSACLRIITPEQATAEFGDVSGCDNGKPRMIALSFKVESLDRLEDCLITGRICYEKRARQIVIPPADAFHIALSFHEVR